MPPSLPAPRTASFLSESLRVMVETLFLSPRRGSIRVSGRSEVTGDRWHVAGCRWRVAGSPGRAGPQFVCTALTGPACGGQAEKLLVRHTNTTPLHLRCD